LVLIELYDPNLRAFGTSISEVVTFLEQVRYRPYILIEGNKVPFKPAHYNRYYNVFFER
jgi:hypothetical protein